MNFNTTIKLERLAKLPFLTSALLVQNGFGALRVNACNDEIGFRYQSAVNESDIGLSLTDGFFPFSEEDEL